MNFFAPVMFILSLSLQNVGAADKAVPSKKTSAPPRDFVKIDEAEPKKPKYIKIDDDEEEETNPAPKVVEDKPKEQTWEDGGGQSLTGVPRLIRHEPMTEVFFRDLKDSYVIHTDSKHNANYKVFDEAAKANRPVSFRADPVSRRILVVDGVNGVKAPAVGNSTTAPTKAGSR